MRNSPMPLALCYPEGIPQEVLDEVGRACFILFCRARLGYHHVLDARLRRCR